jgi:hypothetical protein
VWDDAGDNIIEHVAGTAWEGCHETPPVQFISLLGGAAGWPLAAVACDR